MIDDFNGGVPLPNPQDMTEKELEAFQEYALKTTGIMIIIWVVIFILLLAVIL